jgi:outer membrane receptor protein involved in Fe transport
MTTMHKSFALGAALLLCLTPILAQEPESDQTGGEETTEQPQEVFEGAVVVTASRNQQSLHEVPSAVTILTAEDLEAIPADDYGDYLRNVPGLNVSQLSARDIQVTGRQATTSVATGQLVLLDGRSVYLDFFGFVGWDFLPLDFREIEQIEVVRGPGSAVWGANAMHGVINLITKPPADTVGTRLTLGAGGVGTLYGNITHSGATERLGYRLSAGYYEQDPYERPSGLIPGTETPYPDFENVGTEQPKLDLRIDYDQSQETTWTFSAGYGGTGGMMHTGMGPFVLENGSSLSHLKVDWLRRAMRVSAFANFLEGDSVNLLTRGSDGLPLLFTVETETYNIDYTDTRVLGRSHILTYGLNRRRLNFDLNIAPEGDNRNETGVFLQDEILFGDKIRWLVGARWDDIEPVESVVSPRTSLLISPWPNHTFRLAYGEAFRAPSLLNNFMDTTIVFVAPLPSGPFVFPSAILGNLGLQEERLDSYEVGYVGTLAARTTVSLSAYYTRVEDATDFSPATFYTSDNPPPGWPLPPIVFDSPPPFGFAGLMPASFSFHNIGLVKNQGLEVGVDSRLSPAWSLHLNYSFQDDPRTEGIPAEEINKPPRHRANLGATYNGRRFFASGNVNFVDEAFWTDVLDETFWGPTDAYTQLNLSTGVRLANDRVTLSLIGQNVLDEEVQQHIFGDIISRKVVAELRVEF